MPKNKLAVMGLLSISANSFLSRETVEGSLKKNVM